MDQIPPDLNMPAWAIHYTEQFRTDIGRVPVAQASRWLEKLSYLRRNPYGKNSNVKRLKGLSAGFRLRIGGVRIIYRVLDGLNRVLLLRALPRGSAYQILTAEGRDVGDLASIFNSTDSVREESVADVTEPEGPEGTALIDVDELFLIGVPNEFHARISSAESAEELSAMDIPSEIKLRVEDYLTAPGQTHVGRIYQLGAAESLPAIAAMDLSACSLVLDRQQQEIIERPLTNGPYLVKGGPGTGKTLVALHRLREAYRQRLTESLFDGGEPYVAFLTYNRVLTGTSAALLERLIPEPRDIKVVTTNIDKAVVALAQKVGCNFRPLEDDEAHSILGEVISRSDGDARIASSTDDLKALVTQFGPQFVLDEIEEVIYANGIRSKDEYLRMERVGRKTPLRAQTRTTLWSVFEAFDRETKRRRLTTFEGKRLLVLDALVSGRYVPNKANVLVVDEVQDLSPTAVRLVLQLVKDVRFVTFLGDGGQSIFRRSSPWRSISHELRFHRGNSFELARSYRCTQELERALRPLRIDPDDPEKAGTFASVFTGPRPHWIRARASERDRTVSDIVRSLVVDRGINPSQVAVIVRFKRHTKLLLERLKNARIDAYEVKKSGTRLNDRKVHVINVHACKGLEIPFVIVAGVNNETYPSKFALAGCRNDGERQEVSERERRLLYVALSRSSRELWLVSDTERPCSYLDVLNSDDWDVAAATSDSRRGVDSRWEE